MQPYNKKDILVGTKAFLKYGDKATRSIKQENINQEYILGTKTGKRINKELGQEFIIKPNEQGQINIYGENFRTLRNREQTQSTKDVLNPTLKKTLK